MELAIAADHAGFDYKEILKEELKEQGHQVRDLGTYSKESVDYPDIAEKMALRILERAAERGILVCGSGIGMSMVANKFPGIRAAVGHTHYSAYQSVEHDDANILCIGQRVLGIEVARDIVFTFIEARYSGDERHKRRVRKIGAIEKKYSGGQVQ